MVQPAATALRTRLKEPGEVRERVLSKSGTAKAGCVRENRPPKPERFRVIHDVEKRAINLHGGIGWRQSQCWVRRLEQAQDVDADYTDSVEIAPWVNILKHIHSRRHTTIRRSHRRNDHTACDPDQAQLSFDAGRGGRSR